MKQIVTIAFSILTFTVFGQVKDSLLNVEKDTVISKVYGPLIDKVVGKVGSEIILYSEVEDEYSFAMSNNPSGEGVDRCNIIENIIAQKIIVYQAIVDSVEVTDAEIEGQLDLRFDHILRQMNGD